MRNGMLRRDFLRLASAAGAGLILPGCGNDGSSGSGESQEIVVLGAGMAGLTAAFELVKAGHRVTVLEAQERVGGRILTSRGFPGGAYGELGATRIPDVHEQTLGYVDELGLELEEFDSGDSLYFLKGNRFVHREGDAYPLDMKPIEQEKGLGMWEDYIAANFDLFGNIREGTFPAPGALEAFDDLVYVDFLRQQGASEDWLRLYSADQGSEVFKIGTIAWMVLEVADQSWDKTFHIKGGNDLLPQALASRLGDRIRFGAAVRAIDHGTGSVKVTYEQGGKTRAVTAEHVVCTLPFPILREIEVNPGFSSEKQRVISELYMMPASRACLSTATRFWKDEGIGGLKIAKTDTPIERLWDLGSAAGGDTGMIQAYMQYQNAEAFAAVAPADRQEYALTQIEAFYPQIRDELTGYTEHIWGDDPYARGAWTDLLPGQASFLSVAGAAEGRVHFAGEHTSVWAGWIQGAIESGKRAAYEIDASIAFPYPLVDIGGRAMRAISKATQTAPKPRYRSWAR